MSHTSLTEILEMDAGELCFWVRESVDYHNSLHKAD